MATLLLIEDEDSIRQGLRDHLRSEGHRVMEAPNGRLGLALFRAHHPDVVITDILMPEKDGLEVIMEIRKEQPDARIIAMSAREASGLDLDVLGIAKKLGACATLEKPFEYPTLSSAIEACFRQKS